MLLLPVHSLLSGSAVHHDTMLTVPELPGAPFVHDAAELLEIVEDLRSVGNAERAPEDLMELGGGEEGATLGADALLPAVCLQGLQGEVVREEYVNQSLLLFVLLVVFDECLVLLRSQIDLTMS